MRVLLFVNLVFFVGGIVMMAMAYRERNREIPWFSFKLDAFRVSLRERFSAKGLTYYIAGAAMFVIGGLAGFVYWTFV